MAREAKKTANPEKFRTWDMARCRRPATAKGTGKKGKHGVLRIDFPAYRGVHSLQEITWDEFFEKFDREGLEFLYQEKTATGKPSRFCKLDSRATAAVRSR